MQSSNPKYVKTRIYTYYKGYLECQYAFTKRKPLGKSDHQYQHHIELQPRFRFHKTAEIQEEEYNTNTSQITSPHIRHIAEEHAEILNSKHTDKSFSVAVDEIIMIMNDPSKADSGIITADGEPKNATPQIDSNESESNGFHSTEKAEDENKIQNWNSVLQYVGDILRLNSPLPLNPYITQKGVNYFGRFHGFAYCRAYTISETLEPHIEPTATPVAPEPLIVIGGETTQQLCKFINQAGDRCTRVVDAGIDYCFEHRGIVPSNSGCFENNNELIHFKDGVINRLPIGMRPMATGCFKGMTGMGCFSPLMSWITAIGSLLIGLSLLALAWCFLFGDCGKSNSSADTKHQDTVYVEVFRELKDTLKIVQMDTVSFVDSTIKSKYEMVSLPNVQFYTDSDILLPSSARELQQLAEYLVKNQAVDATIIGHTDNTGDALRNLNLSSRRAESVKRFLESLGVKDSRLQTKGMGDKQPKANNNTEEGRLMNRRVEVELITKSSTETKRTELPKNKATSTP